MSVYSVYVIIGKMEYTEKQLAKLPARKQRLKLGTTKKKTFLLGSTLVLVLATAAFVFGMRLGDHMPTETNLGALFVVSGQQPDTVDLNEFWQIWELLEERFVAATGSDKEALTNQEKIYAATQGLVDGYGDPYTVFLKPEETTSFEEEISGNFGGVGIEVGVRNKQLTVIAPLPSTPADQAGIISGDVIVSVDDILADDLRLDEVVKLIRGEVGTEVKLTILREGEYELLEIPVTRGVISIPTVETEKRGNVFIIRLFVFNALAEEKMQLALKEYRRSGAGTG